MDKLVERIEGEGMLILGDNSRLRVAYEISVRQTYLALTSYTGLSYEPSNLAIAGTITPLDMTSPLVPAGDSAVLQLSEERWLGLLPPSLIHRGKSFNFTAVTDSGTFFDTDLYRG